MCALIAANRPPDVLIAAAFALYVVWEHKRLAGWLVAGAALPAAALLSYNLAVVGKLGGGYALAGKAGRDNFFHFDALGLPGLLISPTRGLLVFSPFLIFIGVGLARRLRTPEDHKLAVALSLAVASQLVVYSQTDWRAGVSWGPRWLTDLLPILVWMLAPAALALRPRARRVLVALAVFAVGVQAVGAFWYEKTSDERIFADAPLEAGVPKAAWSPRNTPFIQELSHRYAAAELQCSAHGSIDAPRPPAANGGKPGLLKPGEAVQGWALSCGRTPAQVILLIDGRVIGQTQDFVQRPDVNTALHTSQATGWSVPADTTGVSLGRHVLQLAVRIAPRGDIRIVREQAVTVTPPPDLAALAARAASRLRDDQARPGYWLTAFTSGPRWGAAKQEMNTYLTSVIVDLLAPVARRQGLTGAVARARRHLAAQIESNGLVRYHGLPDAPTIGTLGCKITPDADDTALAWRIAGKGLGDPRARRMLAELARYRRADGLYRTWLAPQARYECLDPGSDPDPADLTINMHVYLMLRRLDPPASRSLCQAMQRAAGNEGVWVYYAKTALVPYLRSAELGQLGCSLPLPTARLADPVPGQEWWSQVARELVGGRRLEARRAGAHADRPAAHQHGPERLRATALRTAAALPQRPERDGQPVLLV